MSQTMSPDLTALPPAATYLYDVLEREGPHTRGELVERTDMPERTVESALVRLMDERFVRSRPCQRDLRAREYYVATNGNGGGGS